MAVVKSRRRYNSRLREEQARQTRQRILEAAQHCFTERGYAAATMESVATEAGVSVDTVYATFGTKRGVLTELSNFRAAGDDQPVAVIDRTGPQSVRREQDPRRQIAMFAPDVTRIIERVRPVDDILRIASAVDTELSTLRNHIHEQRFASMRTFAGWLATSGELREGMSTTEVATIIWTLTSPEVHRLLRDVRGWSRRRYVRWLDESLTRLLLQQE